MTTLQKIGAAIGIGFLFMSFRKGSFASPVKDFDIRDCDPAGCGHYGASRKHELYFGAANELPQTLTI